jgi:hypothetical protein
VSEAIYSRVIDVPDIHSPQATKLVFGAVNHRATLTIQSVHGGPVQTVGINTTSWTPSSFDLTPFVRPGGRYLIISTTSGTAARNQVHVKDLQDPYAMPVTIVDKIENDYSFVGNDGPVLYFRTDLKAPKGRLISIDLRNPASENWKEIIPEGDAKLQSVRYTGHLSAISINLDRCSAVSWPVSLISRSIRSTFPSLVSHSAQSAA